MVGGGVVGLSVALSVLRRGAGVTLYEAGDGLSGASGVAAGMLAPAFEAALDPVMTVHAALLRAARDLWPAFSAELSAPGLTASGAVWIAGPSEEVRLLDLNAALLSVGSAAETITADQAHGLQPSLSPRIVGGVLPAADWALAAGPVVQARTRTVERLGGAIHRRALAAADLETLGVDAVVLAIGAATRPWLEVAAELEGLTPVKGQILHYRAGPLGGVTVRGAGATMARGVSDATPHPLAVERLRASAARLFPHLRDAPAAGRAGVRAATPDGLPLVGPSLWASARRPGGPGVFLATGARRNGWLLAPMIGAVVADHLCGAPKGEWTRAFAPDRFKVQVAGHPGAPGAAEAR